MRQVLQAAERVLTKAKPIIQLVDLCYTWPGQDGFGLSVDQFRLDPAERVLLLGASGSGKSTLLSLICGTLNATSGVVLIGETDLGRLSTAQKDRFRADHIGIVFQQFNLLPFATVQDNILLPLACAKARRERVQNPPAEAARLCQALGLPKDTMTKRASALSVGQQQRVAVARALIGAPPILIADEPTSALDAATQAAFLDVLFEQAEAQGTSVLMVSHDARLGMRFDRTASMDDLVSVPA